MAQSTEILPNGLQLLQDDRFFKLGQDSVLLSAFAKPRRNAKLLDLGCGTGALALLVWRPDLKITGLELQDGPLDLFRQSITVNGLENVTALQGDLRQMRTLLPHGSMDYVSATRRISTATRARSAPTAEKRTARQTTCWSRNWRLRPRSCCIRRQSRVRIPAGAAVGAARSALARAARAEKNAVRAPERAGVAKRRHGRVPKRRQCGRTCC
ncbi:MAG: methyltransferase domain-containing protein [Butyricicoccus sp.]